MTDRFRITLAQSHAIPGDLGGNADRARAAWQAGRAAGSDLVALPALFLTGGPEGLHRPDVVADAMAMVERLAADCADGPALAIGVPHAVGDLLHDAYIICQGGRITARVFRHAPTRHEGLDAGPIPGPVAVGPVRIGTPIGTDAWSEDVAEAQAESGAEILLVPAAVPYRRGGHDVRLAHMVARVVETGLPLIHLNAVGGQGVDVYDGASFVLNQGGALAAQMPFCAAALAHIDLHRTDDGWRAAEGERAPLPQTPEADYRAMVAGLTDALHLSGRDTLLLPLSDEADSALVAAIAADAVGPANLRLVTLGADAQAIADRLGCRLDRIDLGDARRALQAALAPVGGDVRRLDAAALDTLADAWDAMRIGAGDNAADYNPIADLDRTHMLRACRWRNATHRPWMQAPAGEVIPPDLLSPQGHETPQKAALGPDPKLAPGVPGPRLTGPF